MKNRTICTSFWFHWFWFHCILYIISIFTQIKNDGRLVCLLQNVYEPKFAKACCTKLLVKLHFNCTIETLSSPESELQTMLGTMLLCQFDHANFGVLSALNALGAGKQCMHIKRIEIVYVVFYSGVLRKCFTTFTINTPPPPPPPPTTAAYL